MPRNYLSKRLALKICYELWTWLAENPLRAKGDWPGWKKYINYAINLSFFHYCPCCEWVKQRRNLNAKQCVFLSGAKYCPLKPLWPQGCEQKGDTRTPWEFWMKGHPREKAKQAQIIADAAYKEWQKLEKKRKPTKPQAQPVPIDKVWRGRG